MSAFSVFDARSSQLGPVFHSDGSVTFSVFSENAHSIDLCLFEDEVECARIRIPRQEGPVWSVRVSHPDIDGMAYGYRVHGPWRPLEGHFFNPRKLLLDPYAREVTAPSKYHPSMVLLRSDGNPNREDSAASAPIGRLRSTHENYDWEGDAVLGIPMQDSVFYELHVKGFSQINPEIPEELRGSYAGLAHPKNIKYLKDLGVTSVQLLPVHHHLDDGFLQDRGFVNYWGYNTLGYFAPEVRYASTGDPVREFRDMVKEMHRAGLEVILDVVYNHTCEANLTNGPTCFLRGFDNGSYYHSLPGNEAVYQDFTGCGNSLDMSHPGSLRLVLDSLRYWIEEMHVDGFRFDLAVEQGRDPKAFSRNSAFFRAVSQDPMIRQSKLIAEPWDLGEGGFQLGNFPVDWAELNGSFRDCARSFWRGDLGRTNEFATRITGSSDLYQGDKRRPIASLNLITSHDGYTMHDLVSYERKHNLVNGENNRDGDNHNISSNHGVEGETDDPEINRLRRRQIRNFLATCICAQGVPFLTAGDERLRTQQGNNNAYCQDNEISWLNWEDDTDSTQLTEYVKALLEFKRTHPALNRKEFFTGFRIGESQCRDVNWLRPNGIDRDVFQGDQDKSGAFTMWIHRQANRSRSDQERAHLLFFFNARSVPVEFHIPIQLAGQNQILEFDTKEETGRSGKKEVADGTASTVEAKSIQIWKVIS